MNMITKKNKKRYYVNVDLANKSMKAMFYLLTFLLIISMAQATAWLQYTPSPTSNNIARILSLSNGYGFAYTTSGTNFLLYNQTGWEEINKPSSFLTSTINLAILTIPFSIVFSLRFKNIINEVRAFPDFFQVTFYLFFFFGLLFAYWRILQFFKILEAYDVKNVF